MFDGVTAVLTGMVAVLIFTASNIITTSRIKSGGATAKRRGVLARAAGRPVDANPYERGWGQDYEAMQWAEGWLDEELAQQEAKNGGEE